MPFFIFNNQLLGQFSGYIQAFVVVDFIADNIAGVDNLVTIANGERGIYLPRIDLGAQEQRDQNCQADEREGLRLCG